MIAVTPAQQLTLTTTIYSNKGPVSIEAFLSIDCLVFVDCSSATVRFWGIVSLESLRLASLALVVAQTERPVSAMQLQTAAVIDGGELAESSCGGRVLRRCAYGVLRGFTVESSRDSFRRCLVVSGDDSSFSRKSTPV